MARGLFLSPPAPPQPVPLSFLPFALCPLIDCENLCGFHHCVVSSRFPFVGLWAWAVRGGFHLYDEEWIAQSGTPTPAHRQPDPWSPTSRERVITLTPPRATVSEMRIVVRHHRFLPQYKYTHIYIGFRFRFRLHMNRSKTCGRNRL